MKNGKSSLANLVVAGPCSAETEEQVLQSARELKKQGVQAMRACLWKPRTKPGFDGVGIEGLNWLIKAADETGLIISTEVIIPEHVSLIAKKIATLKNKPRMMLWIGSRNQNHMLQREIAKRVVNEMPKDTILMIKNQPWIDSLHWVGIVEHAISAGFPKENLMVAHRGFSANKRENPRGYRNLPDHEEAMYVKEVTNLPMLLDPSHIGGTRENVVHVIKNALKHDYDGMIIEVHPDPKNAKTDAKQQVDINLLKDILEMIKNGKEVTYKEYATT
jgi:chorismate mutase